MLAYGDRVFRRKRTGVSRRIFNKLLDEAGLVEHRFRTLIDFRPCLFLRTPRHAAKLAGLAFEVCFRYAKPPCRRVEFGGCKGGAYATFSSGVGNFSRIIDRALQINPSFG